MFQGESRQRNIQYRVALVDAHYSKEAAVEAIEQRAIINK